MKSTRIVATGALTLVMVFGLAACSGEGQTSDYSETVPGDSVIAPVSIPIADVLSADSSITEVELAVGQVLNLTTGDAAVTSFSGASADTSVAIFVAGASDGSADFNPGFEAVKPGSTRVWVEAAGAAEARAEFTITVVDAR